jgi:serine protein kinase
MECRPIYVIKGSPVNESPLGLFPPERYGDLLEGDYGIPRRYLNGIMSPWAVKRLQEYGGDISQFRVARVNPSVLRQIAITKTEPGDENNQDISSLVGKVDIRKLEHLSQNDPDAYSYSGGLCLANQGMLEFVEMFKAPIKMLHPLLTATQEGNFKGTEGFSAIPFNGLIVAHSNESEWQSFRNNKNNEAFLDRIFIVKVPYCTRVSEEVKIYEKLLANSSLAGAPCSPGTLEMMAQFSVLTRLKEPENSSLYSKMRVYDGETLKDVDPKAKTIQEYRDYASPDEGMTGMSTRFAYKVLSAVFNHDHSEIAANPVHLMYVLEQRIAREDLPDEMRRRCIEHIKGYLAPRYAEFIGKEIQTAYLESYAEYGQNIFDRYVTFADCWIQEEDYRDPETGESFDRQALNSELEKIEKPAGIANPKDFRNEIVNFVLRARANNGGRNPTWSSYEKLREVIEKKMFSNTEDLLPVISFNAKASADEKEKHRNFVARMVAKGYTEKQVRLLAEWYLRVHKSS